MCGREGVRIIDKNVAGYLRANSLSKLLNWREEASNITATSSWLFLQNVVFQDVAFYIELLMDALG
jgi:hypothetical protein